MTIWVYDISSFKDIPSDHFGEDLWNSLSKPDQLKVFCAVSRRIFLGEINEQHSYRGMLYDVLGFGPEAYALSQAAGYLDIHNQLMGKDYDKKLLSAFVSYVAESHPEILATILTNPEIINEFLSIQNS